MRGCTPSPFRLSLVLSRCIDKNLVSAVDGERQICVVRPIRMKRGSAFVLNLPPKWNFFPGSYPDQHLPPPELDKITYARSSPDCHFALGFLCKVWDLGEGR